MDEPGRHVGGASGAGCHAGTPATVGEGEMHQIPGAGSRRSRNPQELSRYPAAMAIDGVRVKRIAP